MSESGLRLRQYIKDNGRLFVQCSLKPNDGFRFEDDILFRIREKVLTVEGKPLCELFDIRRGGESGNDKAFIINGSFAKDLLTDEKYRKLLKKTVRGKNLIDGKLEDSGEYFIYIVTGWTNANFDPSFNSKEAWFKTEYAKIYNHYISFEGMTERKSSDRYVGDYWWEIADSVARGHNFSKGIVIKSIGSKIDIADYDNTVLPLSSLTVVTGDVPDTLKYFLKDDLFGAVFNKIYSANFVGNTSVKNSTTLKNVIIPNKVFIGESVKDCYNFTEEEVNYLLKEEN